jgi:hypothetical protein
LGPEVALALLVAIYVNSVTLSWDWQVLDVVLDVVVLHLLLQLRSRVVPHPPV